MFAAPHTGMHLDQYLQDLRSLADDCLLPIFDDETALIENSNSNSNTTRKTSPCLLTDTLAPETLCQMLLLNHDSILYNNTYPLVDLSCEDLEPPTPSPPHANPPVNKYQPATPLAKRFTSPSPSPRPLGSTPSLTFLPATSPTPSPSFTNPPRLTLKNLTRVQNSIMIKLTNPTMDTAVKMAPSTVTATALPQRTEDEVNADLQRARRPSNIVRVQNWQEGSSTLLPKEVLADPFNPLPLVEELHLNIRSAPVIEEADPDATQYDDDDESDADDQTSSRPRSISDRKRKQLAIASNYLQERLRNPKAKQTNHIRPGEEVLQNTKWIIDQSEKRSIIDTPREYQIELFERAKEKNIIAVLDTGSGKTLIAVLLLKHILAQELEDRASGKGKRVSFFLVDSVALVFQQHYVLKNNLAEIFRLDMFCGNMGTKLWAREKWLEVFDKNMVVVCTAEVLRQCLGHGFISMDRINLLIFDEAHHAKKDHPYARIIMDFYTTMPEKSLRPKIFGMTASPVDAKVSPRKAAEELEVLLHSEIATAADSSLLQYTTKKATEEKLAVYPPLSNKFFTPLYTQMAGCLGKDSVLKKPFLFAHEASRELGTWCADQMWRFCMEEQELKKLTAKTERKHWNEKADRQMEMLDKKREDLLAAEAIVKAHDFDPPDFCYPSDTSQNLSSKVVYLIKILYEEFEKETESKCIVFVKQRYTAHLLGSLFQKANVKTKHLKVDTLVGTRSGEAGDQNTSFREQVLTMMNFRKGITNCLFATSVAEEGLDIPDCNLIVRFDLYTTVIQYIQSRGRARHANSRFIHMAESGNREHETTIREVRMNEGILKKFCNEVPEDRKLTGNNVDMEYFVRKEKSKLVYIVPTTGARLTYQSSLTVLANFVDTLESSQENNLHPEYIVTVQNKKFMGEVILPEGAPIRGAIGRPYSTKQVAKCSAAFEACKLLIKGSYLDENLLPTFMKKLPAMRNALLAVDSKKRDSYPMKTKPLLWSAGAIPEKLFLTILSLDSPQELDRPSQPLALLTRSAIPKLPSFMLHFGDRKHSGVSCASTPTSLQVSADKLQQINTFTLAIFDDVFSKTYEADISKMPYFLAPLKSSDLSQHSDSAELIAWELLKSIDEHQQAWQEKGWELKSWQTEPDEFFVDKYIVDPYDGSRKLWCKGVAPQYKPLDPVPPNCAPRKGTRQRTDNIMEYSSSLWEKARARRTFDESQRVFEAEFIPLRRNLLDEFDTNVSEGPKRCFIILEILKISALPSTVVSMAYIFPAIIHRIEAYLIALEVCDLVHLDIRPDLALEAVTKDSDNSGDHGEEKIDFQRGMGNNYERLEFLGDCFLKMATSITLYGTKPDSDEFNYHVDRMTMICNKNLFEVAVKLKIHEYIRSQAFNRRAWYPEGLSLTKGKTATAPNSHKLGDKSIADVSEALIGAALLAHQGSNNMDYAVRAVTELVCSENHNVTSWADYYKLYKKPVYQTQRPTQMQLKMAEEIEKKHHYHFQWPRLLRSAFIHPSYPYSYERIPNYQRLEFLGDSLLDMVCVNYLFHNYPGKDPQWLTEHKMAMVSNDFLGCLCVELGFNVFLTIFNQKFQKQVTEYIEEIGEAKRQAQDEAAAAGKSRDDYAPDYWTALNKAPKCLPDIVEAYIGAIFVDSEYDFSRVVEFFEAHIKWYFKDMTVYDSYAKKQPVTNLANFFQVSMCCTDWTIISQEMPSIDGSKSQFMAVVICHNIVVEESISESSRYAKPAAAKNASAKLKGLSPRRYREQYGCTCKMDEGEVDADADADADVHGTGI